MLCHESIESYYTNNFSALYGANGLGIDNRFSLSDFENMLPYEREIYMAMMINRKKEIKDAHDKK